jgi:hypothetical protein
VLVQSNGSMSKTGAVFAYWNTKADGSGAFHGWPADVSFPMAAANVILYAQWFVTTGLPKGGVTAHYAFAYDSSLQASGLEPGRTIKLIAAAEADFGIMAGWFAGVTPHGPSPIPVYVTRLTGGANNTGSIRLNPSSKDPNELRSLLVSEITESFMGGQNKGWGFLPGINNEESCGEGLSLFLTQQFELQQRISGPYTAFTASGWLNTSLPANNPASTRFNYNPDGSIQADFGSRFDYVNSTLPYPGNGPGTGCSILFIYYLFHQLGFTINQIIAAAPGYTNGKLNATAPLRGVYQNLASDKSDPFPSFKELMDFAYPPDQVSAIPGPVQDDPFPLYPLGNSSKSVKNMAISRTPNHLDVFWVGPDGGVGTAWWDANVNSSKWNPPFPIAPPGAAVAGAITCVSRTPNHLDVFWIGPDGGVGTTWWDANLNSANWNTPFPIASPGAAVAGAITCVARSQNHLDVFWVGPDGGVGTTWWDANVNSGKWNPPFPIAPPGAAAAGAITCVARSQNHLDVFWIGPDGGVGTAWWDSNANSGKWSSPFPIAPPGAASGRSITCVARSQNHLDVFWVGPDGGVGTAWWDANINSGKWNPPFPIAPAGAASGRAITCVARNQYHLDVFWVGPDGGVGTAWWDANANSGKWNTPFPIARPGAASGRAVYVVSRTPNHLDVFWVGPDGGVGTAWWDANINSGKWNPPFPIAPPGAAVA